MTRLIVSFIIFLLIQSWGNSYNSGKIFAQKVQIHDQSKKTELKSYDNKISSSKIKWPPQTGKNDSLFATIPSDAELNISIPEDDPINFSGTEELGSDGKFLPRKGSYFITGGSLVTELGQIKKIAKFNGWDYVYNDEKHKDIYHWGPCLVHGELLIPSKLFSNQTSDLFVNNYYECEDFGEKYILVKLDSTKNHKIVVISKRGGFMITVGLPGSKAQVENVIFQRKIDGWYVDENKVSE